MMMLNNKFVNISKHELIVNNLKYVYANNNYSFKWIQFENINNQCINNYSKI